MYPDDELPEDEAPGEDEGQEELESDLDGSEILELSDDDLRREPIPPRLYFAYQDAPPATCLVCEQSLDDGRPFQIQKAFQGDEVVLEMCLCFSCCNDLAREFSKESLEIMRRFVTESFQPGLDRDCCHACDKPRDRFSGHTVAALCQTRFLLMKEIIICDECNMRLEEGLSQKTRDVHRDFVKDHFPGVPEGLDLSPSLVGL